MIPYIENLITRFIY